MKNNRQIIIKLIKRNLQKFWPRDLEIYDTDMNYYETIQAYVRYLRKCKKTTLYKELWQLTYYKKETKKQRWSEYYDTIWENYC